MLPSSGSSVVGMSGLMGFSFPPDTVVGMTIGIQASAGWGATAPTFDVLLLDDTNYNVYKNGVGSLNNVYTLGKKVSSFARAAGCLSSGVYRSLNRAEKWWIAVDNAAGFFSGPNGYSEPPRDSSITFTWTSTATPCVSVTPPPSLVVGQPPSFTFPPIGGLMPPTAPPSLGGLTPTAPPSANCPTGTIGCPCAELPLPSCGTNPDLACLNDVCRNILGNNPSPTVPPLAPQPAPSFAGQAPSFFVQPTPSVFVQPSLPPSVVTPPAPTPPGALGQAGACAVFCDQLCDFGVVECECDPANAQQVATFECKAPSSSPMTTVPFLLLLLAPVLLMIECTTAH